MTINNIENTLKTLKLLHPNLNEKILVDLLKAGGWEEKTINETLVMFHNWTEIGATSIPNVLPPIEEDKILPSIIDASHELLEHNPNVIEKEIVPYNKNEIPDNLPVLISENEKNILPFINTTEIIPLESKLEIEKEDIPPIKQKEVKIVLVPLSEKDEELLLMAYVSLFIILLFLGYRYFIGQ